MGTRPGRRAVAAASLATLLGSLLLDVAAGAIEIDLSAGCRTNPAVVAPCETLRGRLKPYNGSPTLRLWPVGSTRLKGLVPSEDKRTIPARLAPYVDFAVEIWGTFLFCPFTPLEPGRMQFGCIESARSVVVCDRRAEGPPVVSTLPDEPVARGAR